MNSKFICDNSKIKRRLCWAPPSYHIDDLLERRIRQRKKEQGLSFSIPVLGDCMTQCHSYAQYQPTCPVARPFSGPFPILIFGPFVQSRPLDRQPGSLECPDRISLRLRVGETYSNQWCLIANHKSMCALPSANEMPTFEILHQWLSCCKADKGLGVVICSRTSFWWTIFNVPGWRCVDC